MEAAVVELSVSVLKLIRITLEDNYELKCKKKESSCLCTVADTVALY